MKKCPLLNKKCIEHQCEWYTHLIGNDPQTGKQKDDWSCAIAWLPVLLIENSQMTRQVKACLDRNNNVFTSALDEAKQRVLMNQQELQRRALMSSSNLLNGNNNDH